MNPSIRGAVGALLAGACAAHGHAAEAWKFAFGQGEVPAAAFIVDDFTFDPTHPAPVAGFAVPPGPHHTQQRPLGDEEHK